MNNLQLQKFQFLRFTENKPNEDRYGVDVWDQEKIFLKLKSGEVYALYLDLGLDIDESIIVAAIYNLSGQKFIPDLHFNYQITAKNGKHYLIFFLGNNMIVDNCFCFYFSLTTTKKVIFSNYFTMINDETDRQHTTLLTFSHAENFYNANYADNQNMPQQIRVPMYFSHDLTEVEAEKYQDSYRIQNIYRTGKVKRLFFEEWKILINDMNYAPFSVAMDSDEIYFDKTFFNVKPFSHEQDSENKGFTISKVEAQRIANKIFDDSVFGDFFQIKADDITYNFEYHHAPENTPLSGEQFLVNLLFINYTNFFGVVYDCALKAKITEIPTKGKLFSKATGQFISVGDLVSYCDKDDLVYYPNGFENDLGVYGGFTVFFKYKIIDHLGNTGSNIMTQTINMVDLSEVIPIILTVNISWLDGTIDDKTGELDGISMKILYEIHDINCEPLQLIWQRESNGEWVNFDIGNPEVTSVLFLGVNRFRISAIDNCGNTEASNILQYTKTQPPTPVKEYWYKAIHPQGHAGIDRVTYINAVGVEETEILTRAGWVEVGGGGDPVWVDAPCTQIFAQKIIFVIGASTCIP